MEKRIEYIDIAKCIALLLVVYSHTPGALLQTYLSPCLMSAFFFLSGYTGSTKNSWRSHCNKRARRLLVPYIIFSVIFLIISVHHHSFTDFAGIFYSRYCLYPLGTKPNVMFLLASNGPLWFLTALFISDVVYYGLVKKVDNSSKFIKISIIIILLASAILMSHLPILLPWSLDTMPYFELCLLAGHVSRKYDLLRHKSIYTVVLFLVYIAVCYINGTDNLSVRDYGRSVILCLVYGIIGTYILVDICKRLEKTKAGHSLAFAGTHTLTTFAIQGAVIQIVINLINYFNIPVPQTDFAHFIVAIIMLLAVFGIGIPLSAGLRKVMPKIF